MSRKQQKLAEAAKSSRNISQYFVKKSLAEEESREEAEPLLEAGGLLSETLGEIYEESIRQELQCLAAGEEPETHPELLEADDLILIEPKTEVIVLSDDEDEEVEKKETSTPVEDTTQEDMTTTTTYSNISKHFYQTLQE